MTVLVLGIAMMLPLGLYVTVNNLKVLDLQQERWGSITVFMDPAVSAEGTSVSSPKNWPGRPDVTVQNGVS